ncbi:unnamed protein product, partial [marine sediment metagenome]
GAYCEGDRKNRRSQAARSEPECQCLEKKGMDKGVLDTKGREGEAVRQVSSRQAHRGDQGGYQRKGAE